MIQEKNSLKKAQGSSMNVIVVAVIAVLVLLVMTFIFLRGVGGPQGDLNNCLNRGGACEPSSSCPTGTFEITAKCGDNKDSKQKCCVSNDNLINRFNS
jgi:hypothetical protein